MEKEWPSQEVTSPRGSPFVFSPSPTAQPHVSDGLFGLLLGFPPLLSSLLHLSAQLGQVSLQLLFLVQKACVLGGEQSLRVRQQVAT